MTTPDGAANGPHDPDAPRDPGPGHDPHPRHGAEQPYDPQQPQQPQQGYGAGPGQAYGAAPGAGYGDAGGYNPHQAQPYPGVEHGAAPPYGQQGADHPQGWAYVPEPLSGQLPPQAESGAAYGVPASGDAWQAGPPGAQPYGDAYGGYDQAGAPGYDERFGPQPGQEHGRPYGAAAPGTQGGPDWHAGQQHAPAQPYAPEPYPPAANGSYPSYSPAEGDPYPPGPPAAGTPPYPADPYGAGVPGHPDASGGADWSGRQPGPGHPAQPGGPAAPGGAEWSGHQAGPGYQPAPGGAERPGAQPHTGAQPYADGGYGDAGRAGGGYGAQPYPHAYAAPQAPRGAEHTAVLPAYAADADSANSADSAEELPRQAGPWSEESARAAAQGVPEPPVRTGSPIIPPGVQPAALTAVLGLLLAGAAALGNPALAVALLALEGLTAAGWFRLNGMWPARQGIVLAFLGGVTADIALLAADGSHATEVLLGTLGVWLLLVLVLQLRHHGSADERLSSLTATSVSTLLTVVAASLLATAVSGPGSDPVVVGAVAVAAATLVRAVRLPGGEPVSLVLSLLVGAATAWLTAPATGYGSGDALLLALACAAAALIGLRVASYDFPSRFVHFTAGVALPLTAAAPVVYALGTALN